MMVKNSLDALCNLLAPLDRTSGEHGAYVTVFPGTERGFIEFRFDWKTICRELEFDSYSDAIRKSEKILELVDKHHLITDDFHAENDRFNVDYDKFEDELDELLP